jgi:S1-C subfamily serine protease
VERDVSRDQQAAHEMVRRSGQMGVPVITVDDSVVVGFDEPRLERLFASAGTGPRLGASVAPRNGGLLVGQVHTGSLAEKAGLKPADVLVAINGTAVTTTEQLQRDLASSPGRPIRMRVRRDGGDLELSVTPPA